VDVVLLDVQMPELNGLHVARLLRNECAVILTTAYEEHALAGYDLDVVDYLLKPISYERFSRAVEKVLRGNSANGTLNLAAPPSTALRSERDHAPASAAPNSSSPFFVKSGHRTLRIDLSTLLYASSDGDYLTLHLSDNTRILILESLTDLAARLPQSQFCRIHRSHLVALDKIDFVERRRVVIGEQWLPISDGYREAFERMINT
ncbi:MAG: LytTR family DNA-binding domain-containing protein, partial [Bacteroidota bacterium]